MLIYLFNFFISSFSSYLFISFNICLYSHLSISLSNYSFILSSFLFISSNLSTLIYLSFNLSLHQLLLQLFIFFTLIHLSVFIFSNLSTLTYLSPYLSILPLLLLTTHPPLPPNSSVHSSTGHSVAASHSISGGPADRTGVRTSAPTHLDRPLPR